jgi:flagellar FliL protein
MAEEQQPGEEAPKGKKKLLIIIVAVVVLLAGAGGAAFFLMGSDDSDMSAEEAAAEQQATLPEPAAYVNIAQPFLFNAAGKKRSRMVQIKVQVMVRGTENEDLARHHSPLIESTLLSTFGTATVDQLRTPGGRTQLRDQATKDIQATLQEVFGKPVVERVLFTDFVIQ